MADSTTGDGQEPRSLDDLKAEVEQVRGQLGWVQEYLDPAALTERREELDHQMEAPAFWDDQRGAAKVAAERARVQRRLEAFDQLQSDSGELDTMLEMAADEPDWRDELEASLGRLSKEIARLQEEALFTGEFDPGPAVVTVHAGAGGTDSQDWAEMLLRMYQRWAAGRGFKVEMVEATEGEEAGLKSGTFTLTGENAYGIMQAEKGVHRLVRLSPFDSAHRRHTSFAQVEVSPLIEEDAELEIDETELRIDTYRAQGAGGQHVNKTDSAVRITHLPTNIVVQCQNERSQLQNRAQAMRILKSRLIERERELKEQAMAKERGEAQDISFGSQIRSYVLHPYTMVNDHRTNMKIGNAQGVLDGDLDELIHAYLLGKAAVKA
ncbi:MAG: peptide chain release factor 2 [Gaiellales bacterium]|nr:peptide chain release factor 2 [Gaiellales bacterium]